MIITKNEEVTQSVIDYIECDSCHKKIYKTDWIEWQEMLRISFHGGYGSIFGDSEDIMETQLCQKCVMDILGKVLRTKKEEE